MPPVLVFFSKINKYATAPPAFSHAFIKSALLLFFSKIFLFSHFLLCLKKPPRAEIIISTKTKEGIFILKKFMKILSAFSAVIFLFTNTLFAAQSYSWYCMRKKNHERPQAEKQMSFVEKHNAAFIGKNPDEKVIYLTFDAGYENGNVERILDTLAKHKAPGAFFVLDNLIRRNTELVKRMAAEGHLICNHTVRHRNMSDFSREQFEKELRDLENILRENTGLEMAKYYRPPEGRFSEENLAFADEMGYKTIFWSLAYADWDNAKQPAPEKAIALLDANIHNGAIVLLHPTSKTNADILDILLTKWEKDGYRFASLDELFAK